MGEVQGAYVKGARFKIRLENEARAGVSLSRLEGEAKLHAYRETTCNSI